MEVQWKILQHHEPDDFVIATGRQESVRSFVELAAKELGWGGIIWKGKGENEIGIRKDTGEIVIRIDKQYYRPTEVNELLGDITKAKKILGWESKISLEELIKEMILNDKEIAYNEFFLKKKGFKINPPGV